MARKQILGFQVYMYKTDGILEAFEPIDARQISKVRKHMESIINRTTKPNAFLVHVNEIAYYEIYALVKADFAYEMELKETVKVK